jgi:short-subunit dehydrogenase
MQDHPVIVVTGASSGIGAATARLFGAGGYRVVLAARRMERLESLAREIETSGGSAFPVATDVAVLGDIHHLVATTLEHYGRIDVLFNNAGFGRMNWLENLDPEWEIAGQVQINLVGVIHMAQAVLPHMIERRSGHIINMASAAGFIATPTYSVYAASKFGVRGFTEALRRELRVYGIHVSGVYPGGVETEFAEKTGRPRRTWATTPSIMRLGVEEVAQAVWNLNRRPRQALILPRYLTLAIWLNRLFPGMIDFFMDQFFVKPQRNGKLIRHGF